MFYSRRSRESTLPRFVIMCIIGLGLAAYLAWTGYPTRSLVMLSAASLCGIYAGWQAWKLDSWAEVQELFLHRWEQIRGG